MAAALAVRAPADSPRVKTPAISLHRPHNYKSWSMPFYEYECTNCKFYVEALQKISDPPLEQCPSCKKKTLKKLVSAPNFRLKGGGWYETDFKSDQEAKRNLAKDDASGETKSEAKEAKETKSEAKESKSESKAKPAPVKAAKPAAKKSAAKAAKPAKKPVKSKPAAKKK
jgi:putative FmdB family regulatory protein